METYDALENFIMNKNKEAKESKKTKKSPIQNVTNVSDIMNKTPAKKPAPKGVPKPAPKQPIKSVDTPKQPKPKFPTQQEPRAMPVKRPPNGLEDLPDLPEDPELFEDDDDGGFERGDPEESGDDEDPENMVDIEDPEELMEQPLEGISGEDEDSLEPYEQYSEEPDVPARSGKKQTEPEEPQHPQRVITREIPRPLLQKKPNAQSTPIKREKPRLQQQQSRQPVPERGNGMSTYQIQMAERERRSSHVTQFDDSGLENENAELKQQLQETNKKLDELVKYVSSQRKLSTPLEEQYRDEQEQYEEFDELEPELPKKQLKKKRPEKKSFFEGLFKKKEKPVQDESEKVLKSKKKPIPRPQPVTIPQKRYAPAPEPKTRSTLKRIVLALVGIMIAGMGIWLTTAPKMIADIPHTMQIGIVLVAMGVNLFLNEL
jgi:hypothetical protein